MMRECERLLAGEEKRVYGEGPGKGSGGAVKGLYPGQERRGRCCLADNEWARKEKR